MQIYVQSPYEEDGVEKASVALVGFYKTGLLAPNAEEDVEITVNLQDFISYDAKGAKTYIRRG